MSLLFVTASLAWVGQSAAQTLQVDPKNGYYIPNYFGTTPNWANSPALTKFVDGLPLLCGPGTDGENNLGQCIPVAEPDQTAYPGSDYYEIELVEYRERMHSFFPALNNVDKMLATSGGTKLRGYRQINTANSDLLTPHYLGPVIIAQKERPVRILFINSLPTGGEFFLPVDTTIMGAGPGPNANRNGRTDDQICTENPETCFSKNRATLHLHGGFSPWISDGTPHQWTAPVAEASAAYPKGVSTSNVPDMWFDSNGNRVAAGTVGATNNPGPGKMTFYYTNAQSARLRFYHDHAWGITRLNVYAGEAAGYLIQDPTELALIGAGTLPGIGIPLVIQDKTFVNADIASGVSTIMQTDPTWAWGSNPGKPVTATPVTGDLWWPHVYMPAQNPYNPDQTGVNPMGRWVYGPWFWPPLPICGSGPDAVKPFCIEYGEVPNPYNGADSPSPLMPGTPNPSWGAEAFMDTMVVNGTAFPTVTVPAGPVRFRLLNAGHDRFVNLQLYRAVSKVGYSNPTVAPYTTTGPATDLTEVAMVPAAPTAGYPEFWPTDGREGGAPDPAMRGPAFIQIGTEGGFLPAPVVLPNQPVNWVLDPTLFTAGLVAQQNEGGGTLFLGPAETADVIVDFTNFAGHRLILYNDAPAPWPALDPHYDYYTGAPDRRDMGGYGPTHPAGVGPNIRTVMQIVVEGDVNSGTAPVDDYNPAALTALQTALSGPAGAFATSQEPIVVGQNDYDGNYGVDFPSTWPNWGISRISDNSISFLDTTGKVVSNFPMKAKAIQDEMGEVFDDYGRMSAKLGLEVPFTNAGNNNFNLQNFVDPATEIVYPGFIQIWKITHNGVDTHPVHFHLFDVQVLNRVGWDGFMYLPDPNELGWKDTVRISPLEDTIVAMRPKQPPTPWPIPNSYRPLNPAVPLGSSIGFSQIDPVTGADLVPTRVNQVVNLGQEYVWHCHILSHEESDMMRPITLNVDSLLYTAAAGGPQAGLWQWELGNWTQINTAVPTSMVAAGPLAYANVAGSGLYKWDGSAFTRINTGSPTSMLASGSVLYASFTGSGLYKYDGTTWTRINTGIPSSMLASGSILYANFTGSGLYKYSGTTWTRINSNLSANMTASGSILYASFTGSGLYKYDGTTWARINTGIPQSIAAAGSVLYADFGATGLYKYEAGSWTKLSTTDPVLMASGF
jgi:FtsP/CotA-like multicopper oxidase with cupredoxin domain